VRPVSEETQLRLQHGGPPGGRDVLAQGADGTLLGYGRLETDGQATGELVVAPAARGAGTGGALLGHLEELAGDRPLSVWAHGDLPAAHALAVHRGYERARVLLQMRRDLAGIDPVPHPVLPEGVRVLPFRPGRDEQAWLRVNARAFARHPEQGHWTAADLRLREAEPWFDPEGFLLAWRGNPDDGGTLLGFHWTKVHPPGDAAREAIGEIYVLGVDPDAQGLRLGRALTDLGLAHLRGRGLGEVLLYTEEDNTAALALYERSGFRRFSVDVSWRKERSS
jgi:mycothiol synthase